MSDAVKLSVKDQAIDMIQRLPADCSLEDIQYHLFVQARVARGLADVEAGRVLGQDEVEAQVQEWLSLVRPN